jgi:Leucine-rich repeat (LRR) protein
MLLLLSFVLRKGRVVKAAVFEQISRLLSAAVTYSALMPACLLVVSGCGGETARNSAALSDESAAATAAATPTETPPPPAKIADEKQLKAALRAKNPRFEGDVGVEGDGRNIRIVEIHDPALEDISPLAGLPLLRLDLSQSHVTDISPLHGMPLRELYLEDTGVWEISVLRGMPLMKLYLSNTKVEDLGPLRDARQLRELNLLGTPVSDLRPLSRTPIEMLWLNKCPISDISPLQTVPLKSLTLADTKVADLTPLKGHSLERLHIANTPVTDLSVLQWLHLTRLIFTPGRIQKGIEYARNMETLAEIDTEFDSQPRRPLSPAEFWRLYDAGKFQ